MLPGWQLAGCWQRLSRVVRSRGHKGQDSQGKGAYPECFRIGGWQDVGSAYRELSGAGGIRVKVPKVVHVLNASGLAVGRMLAALIVSCQEQGA